MRLREGDAVDAEAIRAFARRFDPQPFHLDEAIAEASALQGLAASGWHSVALALALLEDRLASAFVLVAVEAVKWGKPLHRDAAIAIEIAAKMTSSPPPQWGGRRLALLLKGNGETVMELTVLVALPGEDVADAPLQAGAWAGREAAAADASENQGWLAAPFDEIAIGNAAWTGTTEVDAEAADWFRRRFGGHAEEAAGVPRWQVAAYWMNSYVLARDRDEAWRQARGLPVAQGGPSPGVSRMHWARDVAVGERLRYGMELAGKRRMGASGWALLTTRGGAVDAGGTAVMTFTGQLLWPCR